MYDVYTRRTQINANDAKIKSKMHRLNITDAVQMHFLVCCLYKVFKCLHTRTHTHGRRSLEIRVSLYKKIINKKSFDYLW